MRKIDMTGWRLSDHGVPDSRITVLKEAGRNTSGIIQWECQCDCGNTFVADGTKIRNGHTKSCGCLQKEITSCRTRADLTGKIFGKLTALYPIGKRGGNVLWLCKCECGNFKEAGSDDLVKNQTHSCGCLKSYGESLVYRYLKERNISFIQEYHPPELTPKAKSYPRLDFLLTKDDAPIGAIEVNGIQHYDTNNPWYNSNTEYNQKLKQEYCQSKSIPLLILPYVDGTINYDTLDNFIKTLEDYTE